MGIGIKGFGGTSGGVKGTKLLPPAAVAASGIFSPVGFRYWRLETQGTGSAGTGNSLTELKMTFNETSNFLDAFTLTNIGGEFFLPLSNVNDTVVENSNSGNVGKVNDEDGDMDFYVDFGVNNEKEVTVYSIAPQGGGGGGFNNILGFNAYKSNDAVSWTLVKSFSGISTNPGWSTAVFRNFDLITGDFD